LNDDLGEHEFGGVSTDLKLALVEGYLRAFTTALKGRFELWYIDAFAGTGERTVKHAAQEGGFGIEPSAARVERLKGSARIALDNHPGFDRIVFIDANKRHAAALKQLAGDRLGKDVEVVRAKANEAVMTQIKRKNWSGVRAVMFLDPYGMHVDWATLEGIASTKAIDVWYLVSLSGLFRQATKNGRALSDQKRNAICRMLGTTEWESEWYKNLPKSLFLKMMIQNFIGQSLLQRLRRMFVKDLEQFSLAFRPLLRSRIARTCRCFRCFLLFRIPSRKLLASRRRLLITCSKLGVHPRFCLGRSDQRLFYSFLPTV
jgi:three-Cys-motif partner protein